MDVHFGQSCLVEDGRRTGASHVALRDYEHQRVMEGGCEGAGREGRGGEGRGVVTTVGY